MQDHSSSLFDRPGYIAIGEYLNDIQTMMKRGPWKLPIGIGDRFHLGILAAMEKYSWFSDALFVSHPHEISPAYSILLSYAKRKGILDHFREKRINFPGYYSYFLEKRIEIGERSWRLYAQGVAQDRATALSKSLGEMIERYVSGIGDQNTDVLIASPSDLLKKGAPLIYPPLYHRFSKTHIHTFADLAYDPEQRIGWVVGENILSNKDVLIPKQMTSWFVSGRMDKKFLFDPTTNGSAGHFTKEGAILRGLLEVIERDAFLVHWLTKTPPRKVEEKTLPEHIRNMMNAFRARGISTTILDTTALGIPSVCVTGITYQAEVPQIVISGCSAPTALEAIESAMRELITCSGSFYYESGENTEGAESESATTANLGKIGRQLFWRGKEKLRRFNWFLEGPAITYQELSKNDLVTRTESALETCTCLLSSLGTEFEPIVYSPQNTILEDLGFFVSQVYVPMAFPFYLLERRGTFESNRLRQFARSKGIEAWEINTDPHPFS
jgi:ribosomal protein S12 methylthiotransferase accessory factor